MYLSSSGFTRDKRERERRERGDNFCRPLQAFAISRLKNKKNIRVIPGLKIFFVLFFSVVANKLTSVAQQKEKLELLLELQRAQHADSFLEGHLILNYSERY